jgi:hypothetical protein
VTIFAGICLAGLFTYCLHRALKGSDERDRAEVSALHLVDQQPRHLRLIVSDRVYDQSTDVA